MSQSQSSLFDNLSFDNDVSSVLSDVTNVVNPREWISACIVTLFPPDQNKRWLLPSTYFDETNMIGLVHWCGQFELATTSGILHIHLYMEWSSAYRKRFPFLSELFRNVVGKHPNIQRTKRLTLKSRQSAVNYCLKPDSFIGGDDNRYIWEHNKRPLVFDLKHYENRKAPTKKKSKEELTEEQRNHIESKPRHWTWDQILHEDSVSKTLLCTCSWGSKYHAGRHAEIQDRLISNVVVLYGAGGTGKTTLAQNWDLLEEESQQERYYRRNPEDGAFWGGGRTCYKGQRIIHLEEFCGQEPLSRIKEVCDIGKQGPNVNVKNGGATLNHDTVLFTSNHHPAAWYRNVWTKDPKQFHPFWRRVTQIWFFPSHRPDGTLNIPNDTVLPFYIDQTDEWKSLQGDYQACQDHASEFWPLKEEENYGASAPGFNQV